MSWTQLSIVVSDDLAERAEAIFDARGALSVTLTDAGDQPILEPAPGENPLWRGVRVTALFEPDIAADDVRRAMAAALPGAIAGQWREARLGARDWERAWLDDFEPMQFGAGLWIVPTGCEPPDPAAVNLRFDPGLAFGTGSHPTTALCLNWLAEHPPVGCRVIDYGCGSGILAVAALRLGASEVIGIDNDPQALIASRDNAIRNGVSEGLTLGEPATPLPKAPVVVANILSGTLIDLADALQPLVAESGQLVLAGLLRHQAAAVERAYAPRFSFRRTEGADGWVRLDGSDR